ncbi:molybdopterin-synthase adenylyltransferase MoeB [Oryzihumus sp.]|uniref:molybdopterin-synthase adenylyltransferase MoeB n=1 Tax=Oryzihumus sp. TaxID=1968903 RepID=UPI002EDAAF2A
MALPPLVGLSDPLSTEEVARYARHALIPEVGLEGQRRLKGARVLVVGAGGLGSPVLMYLAAAGVGTIGIVDDDVVETSNLQRQVVHGVSDVGRPKSLSAQETLAEVNPFVTVERHELRLDSSNALEVIGGYDLVVDGTDNFPTRYLVNDACVLLGKPHVWGSIYRFDGQVSIWWAEHGPCYRCVFPEPPPPGLVPSCAEGGVLGVLCAAIGSVQATEAIKLLTGIGEPLVGRVLVHDALRQSWDALQVRKDPGCAVCGSSPTVTELVDYEWFCGIASGPLAGEGAATDSLPGISARDLAAMLDKGAVGEELVLVDVRGPEERAIASIPGAEPIHLDDFRSGAAVSLLPFDRTVVIHCKSGVRSAEAARILLEAGHRDVRNLEGGVLAWVRDVDPTQPEY